MPVRQGSFAVSEPGMHLQRRRLCCGLWGFGEEMLLGLPLKKAIFKPMVLVPSWQIMSTSDFGPQNEEFATKSPSCFAYRDLIFE